MASAAGPRPFPADDPDCELCAAARFTHWYAESGDGWVADCEVCAVPMVVSWHHGPEPAGDVVDRLLALLSEAADERFGSGRWTVDRMMRQVPSHFHAHARDPGWWEKRWTRPVSRYSGVGGARVEAGSPVVRRPRVQGKNHPASPVAPSWSPQAEHHPPTAGPDTDSGSGC